MATPLDEVIRHQVDLQRYSNGVVRRIIAVLNRADGELFASLTAAMERLDADSFTVERLEALLASVRSLNADAYQAAHGELQGAMRGLAEVEVDWNVALYRNLAPIEVTFSSITAEQAYTAALARPFQGRLLREWASSIEAGRMTRIRDAARMGYVQNETVAQVVRRIRGTRARGYGDGLIEIDRRHAEAVARTALSHLSGVTRDRFIEANEDIVGEVLWVSTLDGRTSHQCRIRDGKRYTEEHKPVGHTLPWGAGPGRLHWNCRSTSLPLLEGQKKLFGARASKDGPVDANLTFGDWLKRQPADVQDDVLGVTKGKLFRDGGLKIEAFANERGRELTIDELRARVPSAFTRAGL